MVNFYIVNALGPNLANSESCPILRLSQVLGLGLMIQIYRMRSECGPSNSSSPCPMVCWRK